MPDDESPLSAQQQALWRQYDHLATLEQETTSMRYRTFTAFLSISFLVAGLGAQKSDAAQTVVIPLYGEKPIGALAFVLGFLFFCFSWFFYWWYHQYSHKYRKKLKQLEGELGIEVYRLRVRRTRPIGKSGKVVKFHFDWALRILGFWYFLVAGAFAGYALVTTVLVVSGLIYAFLLWRSVSAEEEPTESD